MVGLGELRDKLLLKQTSVEVGHPLREQGVSDAMLEGGLRPDSHWGRDCLRSLMKMR